MKSWKTTLLPPNATMLEAINIIEQSGLQIGLVVDKEMHLLGTITDGDIRRAILRGTSMQEKAEKIMYKNYTSAQEQESDEKILSIMQEKIIRHLPVLNNKGQVVDLKVLLDIVAPKEKENIVVLMAGGEGTRLSPITNECPKPMLQIGSKSILETILENFIKEGFKKFYISVNYKANVIQAYFGNGSRFNIKIKYLIEKKKLGTAGSLSLMPERPTSPIIVMNGDLLTKISFQHLLEFHTQHKVQATMCVREYHSQVPFGVTQLDGYEILTIKEKPKQSFFINAGIYVLEPNVLDLVPKNKHFDMITLFEKLIAQKNKTLAFPIREFWLDVGQLKDLKRAKSEFKKFFS